MRGQTGLQDSAEELRIRVRALAMPFSGIIEEAADELEASSPDPSTRVLALRWKSNVIPVIQSALFDPDPLVALIDTWTLLAQMRLFFDAGAGTGIPLEARAEGLAAIARMEGEIERLARSVAQPGGVERAREQVYGWAADNPIELTIASRRSAIGDLAALTAEARPGIRKAIGELTLGLGDMWARLDTYSAWLPKQARWHAELLVSQILSGDDVDGAFEDFSTLTRAIDDIAATVQEAPILVTSEREALLQALQDERIATLEALNREFLAAVDAIVAERIQSAEEVIGRERVALLEAVTAERIAVLEAVRNERIATVEDLEDVLGGLAEDSLMRVVDHAVLRLAQLLVVLLILGAIGGFILLRTLRKG
jgi:hypothetical protein